MKRLILPFAIALIVSMAVTTGLVVLRHPKRAATTDGAAKTKTDGAATDSASHADSASHGDPRGGMEHAGIGDTTGGTHGATAWRAAGGTGEPTKPTTHTDAHADAHADAHVSGASVPIPVTKPGPATAALQQHTSQSGEADSGHVSYLAKTFAAMPPRTAAGVMLGMPDEDITQILSSLNAKQRGAILTNFPSDRATKVARLMLHGTGAP